MANLTPFCSKSLLDWSLLGADPVRPSALWISLATMTPNSTSAFEIGTGSGYTRQQVTFGPAADHPAYVAEAVSIRSLGGDEPRTRR